MELILLPLGANFPHLESVSSLELYHLRLILLSVKGPDATSFENLKKFNGQLYSTYKEAARVIGLINDSNECVMI